MEAKKADKKLAKDIRAALKKARLAKLPMEEAADRLGVHRTTLYRVYDEPPNG